MASGRNDDHNQESRRILDRVARESEAGGRSLIARTAKRAHDHVSAVDVDPADPIEHYGTRIGRILGFLVTIGLFLWLISFLIRGA